MQAKEQRAHPVVVDFHLLCVQILINRWDAFIDSPIKREEKKKKMEVPMLHDYCTYGLDLG